MLQRGDERELDALALLVAGVRAGERVVERQLGVRVRLDPHRFGERNAGAVVRVGGRPVVDRQHQLGPALDRLQADVGRDRVQPRAQRAAAFEGLQPPPRAQQRLLQRVLRILRGAEHPVAVGAQLGPERLDALVVAHAPSFGCQNATSPPAPAVTTLRQPAGPSRGASSTDAPSTRARSVAAATSSTST